MSQRHVTAKGLCTYCSAKLVICPECGDWFHARNKVHVFCSTRCRTRKCRRLKSSGFIKLFNPYPKVVDVCPPKDLQYKTGDIILFSGKCWVANTIKVLSWNKWSHVGMVIIDNKYDFPLVYESTHNDKIPGLDIGRNHMGVQVVPLHERIDQYDGKIAVRQLEGVTLSEEDKYRLRLFRRAMQGKPFEQSKRELVAANYRLPFLNKIENLNSLFCSELIAQAYMELGLLPQDLPSNKYVPAHFSQKRKTPLLRGYLGKEIMLSY